MKVEEEMILRELCFKWMKVMNVIRRKMKVEEERIFRELCFKWMKSVRLNRYADFYNQTVCQGLTEGFAPHKLSSQINLKSVQKMQLYAK